MNVASLASNTPRRHSLPARWLLLAAAVLLCVAGCSYSYAPGPRPSFIPATKESIAELSKMDLILTRLVSDGERITLPESAGITLRFGDDNRVAGKSAVNRFFGTYELGPKGAFAWPGAGLGTTRMAGAESAMKLEAQLMKAFSSSTQLLTSDKAVRFQTADGANLAEFSRPPR